jgi:hypothetical protein
MITYTISANYTKLNTNANQKNKFFFFSFPSLLCCVGVHCGIYKGSYNASNISYLNSPTSMAPFIPPPPIHGIVKTGIIIAFTCMCTHFSHFTNLHLLPPTPSRSRTCSTLLLSDFIEEKR